MIQISTFGMVGLLGCMSVALVQAIISQRPCMNVVNYVEQKDIRLIADIVLNEPAGLEGVWLNITFDTKTHVLANKFGPAFTKDNKNYLIKRLDFNLLPGVDYPVRFMVKHNDVVTPNIIKVLLNGRSICPGAIVLDDKQCPFCPDRDCTPSENEYDTSGQLNNERNDSVNIYGDANGKNRFKIPVVEVDVSKVCGTVTIAKDKIHGGLLAEEGNYPWQIALVYTVGVRAEYKCSAGLISQRHALTAAHCVTSNTGAAKSKDEYLLYGGTIKLNSKSENSQLFQLSSLHVHENYHTQSLEDDVALLVLNRLARITDYVRPLCLPTQEMTRRDLYERKGTVAGWGYTENGLVNDLRYANMPIVSTDQCIFSDRAFYSLFISPKVFCAGARNGTTVCQGDSGSPLVLEGTDSVSKEERYYARGIVSLSKRTFGLKCSPKDFAIFTDVRTYLPWIKKIMELPL